MAPSKTLSLLDTEKGRRWFAIHKMLSEMYKAVAGPEFFAEGYVRRQVAETEAFEIMNPHLHRALKRMGSPRTQIETARQLWSKKGATKETVRDQLQVVFERRVASLKMPKTWAEFQARAGADATEMTHAALGYVTKIVDPAKGYAWLSNVETFNTYYPGLMRGAERAMKKAVGIEFPKLIADQVVKAANPASPLDMGTLARRLRMNEAGMTVSRATTIARTETARVYGKVSDTTMRNNGILGRRWLTAGTGVHVGCADNEAQGWVPMSEAFSSGSMWPPDHPRCRCDIAADTRNWLPRQKPFPIDPKANQIGDVPFLQGQKVLSVKRKVVRPKTYKRYKKPARRAKPRARAKPRSKKSPSVKQMPDDFLPNAKPELRLKIWEKRQAKILERNKKLKGIDIENYMPDDFYPLAAQDRRLEFWRRLRIQEKQNWHIEGMPVPDAFNKNVQLAARRRMWENLKADGRARWVRQRAEIKARQIIEREIKVAANRRKLSEIKARANPKPTTKPKPKAGQSGTPSRSKYQTMEIKEGSIKPFKPGQSVSDVYTAELVDGTKIIIKPRFGQPTDAVRRGSIPVGEELPREKAAQRIAQMMDDASQGGVKVQVPEDTVIRHVTNQIDDELLRFSSNARANGYKVGDDLGESVVQQFKEGVEAWKDAYSRGSESAKRKAFNEVFERELTNNALFDSIIGNTDRHMGNALWNGTKKEFTLIDHGLAFPVNPTHVGFGNHKMLSMAERVGADTLQPFHVDMLKSMVANGQAISAELTPMLGVDAVSAMWERIFWMIDRQGTLSVADWSGAGGLSSLGTPHMASAMVKIPVNGGFNGWSKAQWKKVLDTEAWSL